MTHDPATAGEPLDLELGRYILHRVVAPSGDGGVVFSAYERVRTATSRRMAVTILDPRSVDPSGHEARVEAWAAAASFSHPVLHRVADFGEHAGLHYVATPWIDGWSLHDISRALGDPGEAPAVAAVASLGLHLAEALATLHAQGTGSTEALVHGRVSPSRVMVMRSGHVKLLGYGVSPRWSARYAPRPASARRQAWLAPEQVRGDEPDPRTDVYALSLLLHAFHTGSNPLERDDLEGTNQAILEGLHADIAPELRVPLLPGLALDPDQRPSSVRWLAAQLQRAAMKHGGVLQPSDWRVLLHDLFTGEEVQPALEVSPDEQERLEVVISELRAVAVPARPDLEETEAVEIHPPPSPSPRRAGLATWALLALGALIALLLALNGGLLLLDGLHGAEVPEPGVPSELAEVEERPDAVGVYLDEAQRRLAAGDVAPARALLDAARGAGATDPALDARLSDLEVALERATHLLAARTHLEAGEHEEATVLLRAMLDANPDDPQAFALLQECGAAMAAEADAEPEPERTSRTRSPAPVRRAVETEGARSDPEPTGPGKVTIRSQPQSMVYVDGEFVGTTPLVGHVLDAGSHTVEFKLGGRDKVTRTVEVKAGRTAEVEVNLATE